MTRTYFLAILMGLCCLGGMAMAQDIQAPRHAPHKSHGKKAAAPSNASEDWDIAVPTGKTKSSDAAEDPNVSEGRKKFFDQSTTMQGGGPASSTNATGFTPSMGVNF
jgi:hypothetical protein